jgi:hypothetical protein
MQHGRRAEIDAELAKLQREHKALVKAERARSRWWVVEKDVLSVTLILYDMAGGDPEPSVAYLTAIAEQRHWPPRPIEEVSRLVEDLFMSATSTDEALEQYAALVDASCPSDARSMGVALRRIADWHVVMWSRELNERLGAGPSSDGMLQHLESVRAAMPPASSPPARGTSEAGRCRKWAYRLRQRYGGRFGKFKAREVVSQAELLAKVRTAWQWFNYLSTRASVGKEILRINLDETSIQLFQGGVAGNIFTSKKRHSPEPVEAAPLGKRRRCFTHVAFICDRPELQPLMPQYLIGNESTFLVRELAALRAACPANVVIVRQQSAWNNSLLCARIIRRLAVVLKPYMDRLQPVLLLDAARIHLAHALHACRATSIWPLVVPAKTTWLIQPLDTGAFSLFKYILKMSYQRARIASADGEVSTLVLVRCVCEAIRKALQGRRWAGVFDGDGFGQLQRALSSRVVFQLELGESASVPAVKPSLEQLRLCFPRRTKNIPVGALWGAVDGAARGPVVFAAAAAAAAGAVRGGAAGRGGVRGGAAGRGRGDGLSRTRSGLAYKPA